MPSRDEIIALAREKTILNVDDVPDSVLVDYMNAGIADLGTRFDWPFLLSQTSGVASHGTHTLALPLDYARIVSVYDRQRRFRLREVTLTEGIDEFGAERLSGTPAAFWMSPQAIQLSHSVPGTRTYTIHYLRKLSPLPNGDSVPEWDSGFHTILSDYIAARMWEAEQDQREAAAADDRFDRGVVSMARFYKNRASDTPMVWGEHSDRTPLLGGSNTPWMDGV